LIDIDMSTIEASILTLTAQPPGKIPDGGLITGEGISVIGYPLVRRAAQHCNGHCYPSWQKHTS